MFAETELTLTWLIGTLAGSGAVIALLFRLLISSKDRELIAEKERFAAELAEKERARLELESIKKSYQEIAAEALKSALDRENYYRQRDGKLPLIPAAAVVPESHSPSTELQRETALVQTMRASLAYIKLSSGQEARPTPEEADETVKPSS